MRLIKSTCGVPGQTLTEVRSIQEAVEWLKEDFTQRKAATLPENAVIAIDLTRIDARTFIIFDNDEAYEVVV